MEGADPCTVFRLVRSLELGHGGVYVQGACSAGGRGNRSSGQGQMHHVLESISASKGKMEFVGRTTSEDNGVTVVFAKLGKLLQIRKAVLLN